MIPKISVATLIPIAQFQNVRCPNRKMIPIIDRITKCPAVMLPNRRTHSANGLTILPSSSIGAMNSDMATAPGPESPGILGKIVRMYPTGPSLTTPLISMTTNAMIARPAVTPKLPVAVAPKGISPIRFI